MAFSLQPTRLMKAARRFISALASGIGSAAPGRSQKSFCGSTITRCTLGRVSIGVSLTALCAPLDAEHHLSFHNEVCRVEDEIIKETGLFGRGAAHDQPRAAAVHRFQQELPDSSAHPLSRYGCLKVISRDQNHGLSGINCATDILARSP